MVNSDERPPIAAAIITYNPDLKRLQQNLSAIVGQVDAVILVDNASQNLPALQTLVQSFSKVLLLTNPSNQGIATALNQAAKKAQQLGFKWLVTLDQDSISPQNLLDTYRPLTHQSSIGMLCCRILDRNIGYFERKPITTALEDVKDCITSASMIRLSAWEQVGGFYEPFFIDAVDYDFCYLLSRAGFRIVRCNEVELYHEIGRAETVSIFGRKEYLFHHSPTRCYYMIRNTLLLGKRHQRRLHFSLVALKRFLLVVSFEANKFQKAKAMLQGVYDALRGHMGPISNTPPTSL